jgi:hypothetical protein
LVFNGIVPAGKARAHIIKLSNAGIGLRSIAAASDVSRSLLQEINKGQATRIRAQVEARILAVNSQTARGSGNLIPAAQTWRLINRLLREGFTERELAIRLGYKTPVLQINKRVVTAKTHAMIERYYNRIMAI